MIYSKISKLLSIIIIFLVPLISYAIAPSWKIVSTESSITFTGIQNDAPASGSFKKFTGIINFDPNQLNDSKVKIEIDMNSVSTSYSDFTSTLITDDWFNVKLFPTAVFETSHFVKIGNDKYQANGSLTIRDKSVPVTLLFEAKELSKTKVLVEGNTTLRRTQFGVGQGEWADTEAVKDDVQVSFKITADRQ